MSKLNTRRDFLKASAFAAAGLCSARRVWASVTRPANEKLGIAVIGVSGQGGWNLDQLAHTGEAIVALCDVDEPRAADARARFPNARFHVDFRRMLDEQQNDIDAVLIATPDHTHATAAMAAMQAGKHVYCEKPLTHSVWEARQLIEMAGRSRLATQMGTQLHASDNYRRVVELVQSGVVGPIRKVYVWCPTVWSGGRRPEETPPVPNGLHWDLWLGPSSERPYHPAYTPAGWRGWWDFGGGGHSDMACHYMDLAHWALDLRHPSAVEAKGPPLDEDSAPPRLTVYYEYPARGDQPLVKLTWCVGVNRPEGFIEGQMPAWDAGLLFVGEKGKIAADYNQHKLLPEDDFVDFQPPPQSIPRSIGHHAEWIKGCKEGTPTLCDFAYSGALTEAVLLGNVAYRSGRRIAWDPVRMRIPNAPEAEQFLRREYRQGFGWS